VSDPHNGEESDGVGYGDGALDDQPARRSDPRNNADDAYTAFMSMGGDEWQGLLKSLMGGGVLQVEEKKGFDRALQERTTLKSVADAREAVKPFDFAPSPVGVGPLPRDENGRLVSSISESQQEARVHTEVMKRMVPRYDEEVAPREDGMRRLQALVLQMSVLELKKLDLEADLEKTQKELRVYSESLVPEMMSELGVTLMRTAGGAEVELKEDLRASFPKDEGRQAQAFAWLRQSGNDGIIKREITVQYGRDSTEWADQLVLALEKMGVSEHGVVTQEWNIHHQTLLSFLRTEIKEGRPVPMEAFGAVIQRMAKIKRRK